MKNILLFILTICFITGCEKSTDIEVYNENNTSVSNGIVYDIDEKPINGIYRTYYNNGSVKMEMSAQNGVPNGEGKFYDENGNLQYSGTFNQGKITGKFYHYYDDGNIHNELNYDNGIQTGPQLLYDDKGQIQAEVIYKDGKAFSGYVIINGEKTDLDADSLTDLSVSENLEEDINKFPNTPEDKRE